jgi:hypothetical protein
MRPFSTAAARLLFVSGLVFGLLAGTLDAQVDPPSRIAILRVLIADNAASRMMLPLGSNGVELSETGEIDERKLREELFEEGSSIDAGQVVEITAIHFGDDTIEIELDGGGDNGPGILDRIQIGVGNRTAPITNRDTDQATGSKIVLRFEDRAPAFLTVDDLKAYLSPLLDFNKQNFMDSGVESIPVEFQEAVTAGEVKIGMDRSTVLLAMERPDDKVWETNDDGVEQETWIYRLPGQRVDFIVFEEGYVVSVRHY